VFLPSGKAFCLDRSATFWLKSSVAAHLVSSSGAGPLCLTTSSLAASFTNLLCSGVSLDSFSSNIPSAFKCFAMPRCLPYVFTLPMAFPPAINMASSLTVRSINLLDSGHLFLTHCWSAISRGHSAFSMPPPK